jgi:hypothetical protein
MINAANVLTTAIAMSDGALMMAPQRNTRLPVDSKIRRTKVCFVRSSFITLADGWMAELVEASACHCVNLSQHAKVAVAIKLIAASGGDASATSPAPNATVVQAKETATLDIDQNGRWVST